MDPCSLTELSAVLFIILGISRFDLECGFGYVTAPVPVHC